MFLSLYVKQQGGNIYTPKAGFDPPFAAGPIYWMRKDDALMKQATIAGYI